MQLYDKIMDILKYGHERIRMEAVVKINKSISDIFNVLKRNGYEAYVVGGCVRDSILGREPSDWDIATDALPSEVKALFMKTVDTGLKHGTVTVLMNDDAYEVTTFRIDGKYNDGRHPSLVEFTRNIEDDLRRRDFTMNALAWNEERGIVDPFGGVEDIHSRIIRAVGIPEERFQEDALRMLRAIRFAATLDFEIHSETLDAIAKNNKLIMNISGERIRDEITGILTSKRPEKFILLKDTGLLKIILPEVDSCFKTQQHNPHHIYNVGEHTLKAMHSIEEDVILRWTMLLHDIGKAVTKTTDAKGIDHFYGHARKSEELSKNILKRLRFDNKSVDRILRLIRHHDRQIIPRPKYVAKAVNAVGEDIFMDLMKVRRADTSGKNPDEIKQKLEYTGLIEKTYLKLKEEKSCLSLDELDVNGKDLIELGFKEGEDIGRVLNLLLNKVFEDPRLNEKKILLELAAKEIIT
jgi:tRNA nucleotidyltransferase (CCA-adding enzyme)